jgi:hypothetical protein
MIDFAPNATATCAKGRLLDEDAPAAEGAHYTSARGWDAVVALWRQLARLHGVVDDYLDVYGVHKGQIERMDGDPKFEFAVSYIGSQEKSVPFCGWLVGSLVSARAPGECTDGNT